MMDVINKNKKVWEEQQFMCYRHGESDSHSASQEIPCNPNVHYRVYKSLPLYPILSQLNPAHSFKTYVLMSSSHLQLGLPSSLFRSRSLTEVLVNLHAVSLTSLCLNFITISIFIRILCWALPMVFLHVRQTAS